MKKWICLLATVVVLLSLCVPVSAASKPPVYKVSEPKWVKIDGNVTEKEWGKPIYKGVTMKQAEDGEIDNRLTAWWYDSTGNADTTFDLYVTNTDENLYVACVVHNVDPETITKGVTPYYSTRRQMNFCFTFSKWVDGTGVFITDHLGTKYEQFTGYRVYLATDGKMYADAFIQGINAKPIFPNKDYVAKYDEKTRTMTYEVAVPFVLSNVEIEKNNEIAFSAVINLDNQSNTISCEGDGPNRFLVGLGAQTGGGAEKYSHTDQCIKIELATFSQIQSMKEVGNNTNTGDAKVFVDDSADIVGVPGPMGEADNAGISWMALVFYGCLGLSVACLITMALVLIIRRMKVNKEVQPE